MAGPSNFTNQCGVFDGQCAGPQGDEVYMPTGTCTPTAPDADGARLCDRKTVNAAGGSDQQYRVSGGTFSCNPDQMGRLAAALVGTSTTQVLPNTTIQSSVAYTRWGGSDCALSPSRANQYPCAAVTQRESDVDPAARDQCCRNAGTVIACDANKSLSRCGGDQTPGSSTGVAPYGVTGDGSRVQANLYCAPAHCWTTGSDACDDVMATLAAKPHHSDSQCQVLPYPDPTGAPVQPGDACTTVNRAPATCSNMTATVTQPSTGATVGQWFNMAQRSASETRRAMADYAALAYCDAHPTEDTCACLNASFSGYKEPCLGKTYTQLLQDFQAAFGAAAVTTSGIVSRKACWWSPCDSTAASRFVQTSAITQQNNTCPSTALCTATVRNLNVQDPSDVVCIVQNCSAQDCDTVARTVRAIVDEKGELPRATGQACGGCNSAINEALRGTGFQVRTPETGGSSSVQPVQHTRMAWILGSVFGAVLLFAAAVFVWKLRKR